jgi:hypothetical protein
LGRPVERGIFDLGVMLLGEQRSGRRWLVREAPHRLSSRPTSKNMPTDCGRKFGLSRPFRVNSRQNCGRQQARIKPAKHQKTGQIGGTWLAFSWGTDGLGETSRTQMHGPVGCRALLGTTVSGLGDNEGGAHRQLMLCSTVMNMPPKYGMKTSRIRQFWGKSRQYEQNSDCYETRALPLPKKKRAGNARPHFGV